MASIAFSRTLPRSRNRVSSRADEETMVRLAAMASAITPVEMVERKDDSSSAESAMADPEVGKLVILVGSDLQIAEPRASCPNEKRQRPLQEGPGLVLVGEAQ
jgi:hypothetical protein